MHSRTLRTAEGNADKSGESELRILFFPMLGYISFVLSMINLLIYIESYSAFYQQEKRDEVIVCI